MAHIISVTNQKGGVAKTTTATNLAACLAASGRKTLLVDLDPQGNATSAVGIDKSQIQKSTYDLLLGTVAPGEAIVPTELKHLFILPSNIDLVGAETELTDAERRSSRLAESLSACVGDYEYVLIDSPPSLGLLTLNGLVMARSVLIPVQSEYFALEGLTSLVNTVERVRETLNPSLSILGLVITLYDGRTNLSQQVEEEVRRVFSEKVFQTVVRRSVRLSEAASFGKPIILYDFRSHGALDYISLCQELVNVCEKKSVGPRP